MPQKANTEDIGLLISAALALLDFLEPRIADARASGDITTEQQATLKDRIDKFRSGAGFDGPEWQTAQTPTPTPPNPSA